MTPVGLKWIRYSDRLFFSIESNQYLHQSILAHPELLAWQILTHKWVSTLQWRETRAKITGMNKKQQALKTRKEFPSTFCVVKPSLVLVKQWQGIHKAQRQMFSMALLFKCYKRTNHRNERRQHHVGDHV